MKHTFSSREKHLFAVAVLCVGVPLVFAVVGKPLSRAWSEQSHRLRDKQARISTLRSLIRQEKDLNAAFDALTTKIQARLPYGREESQFLNEIGSVAKSTNVHIAAMNPLPIHDLGAFREMSVEIDMEANLGNVVRFLYYMRQASVVLVANKLVLEPKEERSALLRGHLVISTIFMKKQ